MRLGKGSIYFERVLNFGRIQPLYSTMGASEFFSSFAAGTQRSIFALRFADTSMCCVWLLNVSPCLNVSSPPSRWEVLGVCEF